MKPALPDPIRQVTDSLHLKPAVSILMPFHTKINLETELRHALKIAADKVESELKKNYPEDITRIVMTKLRQLIRDLKADPDKKSIAIYISPLFEKIFYLPTPVEEKIIIDGTFEIRDLVYGFKDHEKFYLLLISARESHLFLGDGHSLVKLNAGLPESVFEALLDIPNRIGNFQDTDIRKEIVMHKYIHQIDNILDNILNSYSVPMFVAGTERILGHFKKLTRHNRIVAAFIPGNYEDASMPKLNKAVEPYVETWKKNKQLELYEAMEAAAGDGKLAKDIQQIWLAVANKNCRLLIVEKNYMCLAAMDPITGHKPPGEKAMKGAALTRDIVDDIIENVLQYGGDVQFVDNGFLSDFGRIVLIKYY